jgi:D-aminopeptidase
LLTVGDAQCLQCHVRANSVKGVLGETISVRVEEIKLEDKPIGKLILLLEKEVGEVLIYGELNLREAEDLRIETSQLQFNPLQISTNLETKTVRFQSASLEDLRKLTKYNGDGRLVVKIITNL